MPVNQFIGFATGADANVTPQATYAQRAEITEGMRSGVAESAMCNKAWRQGANMAAAIGEYIKSQGYDALDDGDINALSTALAAALARLIPAVATSSADGLMSAADKTKLDGIAAGAEVNQNAFGKVYTGGDAETYSADSKDATLSLNGGLGVRVTKGLNSNSVYIMGDTFRGCTASSYGSAGVIPAPSPGDQSKFLSAAGGWTIVPSMTGATSSAAGAAGLVPAPAAGDNGSFLRGDGQWIDPAGILPPPNIPMYYTTDDYVLNDIVTSGGAIFLALQDNGPGTPNGVHGLNETAYWAPFVPGDPIVDITISGSTMTLTHASGSTATRTLPTYDNADTTSY